MTETDLAVHLHQADLVTDGPAPAAAGAPIPAGLDSSLCAVPAVFYRRTARAAGSRNTQLALCRAVAAARGSWMSAEFFDADRRAGRLWQDRPQRQSLRTALRRPRHPALVVANPWRLLPGCPALGGASILVRLAFRDVGLMLVGSGTMIATAEEYALLGALLPGPAGLTASGSQSRPLAVRLHSRPGGRG